MTANELKRRYPNASESFIRANLSPDDTGTVAFVESNLGHAPLEKEKIQRPTGERFLIRVTSIRKRLIDESNLCYKFHEDLCRYAGALPDDSPEICHSEVRQRKARKGEPEQTEILIYKL